MKTDETRVILERIDSVQKTVDVIDRDFDNAIKDSQELTLRVGALEGEVRQLKEMIARMPIKVADQVEDAVKPVTKETKKLTASIENKKNIVMNVIKKPFWKFW